MIQGTMVCWGLEIVVKHPLALGGYQPYTRTHCVSARRCGEVRAATVLLNSSQ